MTSFSTPLNRLKCTASLFILMLTSYTHTHTHTHTENLDCLAPPNSLTSMRPIPIVIETTNTTIDIKWNPLDLKESCRDVVFDFATLTYTVKLSLGHFPPIPDQEFVSIVTGIHCTTYIQ